jgi:hypothetical protein
MTTKSKRQYTIDRDIDEAAQTILFRVRNDKGELVPGLRELFEVKKARGTHAMALIMGYNHSIGDCAAKSQGATIQEKFAALAERSKYLMSGTDKWASGRSPSESGLLFRAMSEAYEDWDADRIHKWIAEQKETAKKIVDMTWQTYSAKLLMSKKLAPIVERLRAEEAKSTTQIDTDKLFAELDAQ